MKIQHDFWNRYAGNQIAVLVVVKTTLNFGLMMCYKMGRRMDLVM
jgi:hypothetical protein